MLCRVTPDARNQPSLPYDNELDSDQDQRDDRSVLVPESQEDVSGDSQHSDGFVASSLPAQEAASPPAHPPEPSSPPPPPPPPPGMPVQAEDDLQISPITPLSYDQSSSDEEPLRTRNYLELTDTVTGSRKRIYYDNNFNRL